MRRVGMGLCVIGVVGASWAVAAAASDKDGWIDLFNGKDLSGWKKVGPGGKWVVQDGILIGTQDENGKPGDLMTRLRYKDFELRVEFKVVWPANSGIWFRMPDDKYGLQFDILDYPEAKTGSVWCDGFKNKVPDEKHLNKNGWNTAYIRCQGDHIVAKLNDHKVADFHDTTRPEGRIGLQTHAGDQYKNMKIMFRKVQLRKLGGSASMPWAQKPSNDYCNVCHVDFTGEELSMQHLKHGIPCAKCHGPSVEHMQDEQGMTRADIKFGRAEVEPFCKTCHGPHKHPEKVAAFRKKWYGKTRPNGRPVVAGSICTDCHGKHTVLKQTKRPGPAG